MSVGFVVGGVALVAALLIILVLALRHRRRGDPGTSQSAPGLYVGPAHHHHSHHPSHHGHHHGGHGGGFHGGHGGN